MARYNQGNPIASVTAGGTAYTVPVPSAYTFNAADVSAKDAGRTESGVMYKYKIGTNTQIELQWNGISTGDLHSILAAFCSAEYFNVTYLDPTASPTTTTSGDLIYQSTRTFYVGDRSAPLYNSKLDVWENVKFKIIERGVH